MLDLKKSQTQVHPEPMSWVEKLPDLAEMGTESEGHTGEPISQPCRADPRQRPSHSPAERIHGSTHLRGLQSGSTAAPSFPAFSQQNSISQLRVTTGRGGLMRPVSF